MVKQYFQLVGVFSPDKQAFEAILHPEIEITEFPNRLTDHIRKRNRTEMAAGIEMGRKLMAAQEYTIQHILEADPQLVVEVKWTGRLAIDAGQFKKNQVLTAYICYIFEFKEGKIFRHRNYDCYEAFAKG